MTENPASRRVRNPQQEPQKTVEYRAICADGDWVGGRPNATLHEAVVHATAMDAGDGLCSPHRVQSRTVTVTYGEWADV